jgi:hypothetical protein
MRRRGPPPQPHPGLAALRGQPYIAFVATIESRKDHLFVLNAWLALLRRRGAPCRSWCWRDARASAPAPRWRCWSARRSWRTA